MYRYIGRYKGTATQTDAHEKNKDAIVFILRRCVMRSEGTKVGVDAAACGRE